MATEPSNPLHIIGDRFVLCRWHLITGPYVEDSDRSLENLCSRIPEHLNDYDSDTLSVCEVKDSIWKKNKRDPSDTRPLQLKTLFEIEHYADPGEEEEEG